MNRRTIAKLEELRQLLRGQNNRGDWLDQLIERFDWLTQKLTMPISEHSKSYAIVERKALAWVICEAAGKYPQLFVEKP